MRQVIINNCKAIRLGKRWENDSTEIIFPFAKEWHDTYGDGVIKLLYKRNGDQHPYLCDIVDDGEKFSWIIHDEDLDKPGLGVCELNYVVDNEKVAKSLTYNTFVEDSLGVPSPPPEPVENWNIIYCGTSTDLT